MAEGRDHDSDGPAEAEDDDDLRRRSEWFRFGRTDSIDINLGILRRQALAQAEALRNSEAEVVPPLGESLGKPKATLEGPTRKLGAKVGSVDNPDPEGSLGFAGPAVSVRARSGEVVGLHLRIALDKRALRPLVPESVRICRWEQSTRRWVLVARSGVHVDDRTAWAVLHREGIYVPVGLPEERQRLQSLLMLQASLPLLRAASDAKDLSAIEEALFSERGMAGLADRFADPDLFPGGGIPDGAATREGKNLSSRGNLGGLPGLPELPGLPDLPGLHLAEFELLDDLCPPWRGPQWTWPTWLPSLPKFNWPWFPWSRDWVKAGPNNVSGRIKSLAIHPTNASVVYAGAADGGVWITRDAGLSWTSVMTTQLSMAIGSLAISTSNPSVVYAATGEDTPGWSPSYPGVGVYRTDDGGLTWSQRGAGVVGDRCSKIAVDPGSADSVLLASNNGLWKSTDGGLNWARTLVGHICDLIWDPIDATHAWCAIWADGIYQSMDGGSTWSRSGPGRPVASRRSIFWLGRLPTGPALEWIKLAQGLNGAAGRDLLLAKMGTDSGDVYRSKDRGRSWFRVATGVESASYNEWTNMIAQHPGNDNIVIAGGVGVSRAADGKTFTSVGGTHSDHHQVVFYPGNLNTCWMATDGGVYRSIDAGTTWALRSDSLTATQLYSIGVSQTGSFLLGGSTQDQGVVASDGTLAWRDTNAGNEGGFFVVDPNSSQNVYACPWSANLVRSTDRGFSWTSIRNGMTQRVGKRIHGPAVVRTLAVQYGNSNLLLAAGSIDLGERLYRSTDQGAHWKSVLTPAEAVTCIAFAPSDPNRVYAGTAGGNLLESSSAGAGGGWTTAAMTAPSSRAVTAIAVDWWNRDIVWIGCGGSWGSRVLRSSDAGATWSDASGATSQLPGLPVNAVVVDQNNPDIVYVANDIGVFRTRDGGQSWEDFSNGFLNADIPRILVTGLQLRRSTNTLYASTMGRGAYRRRL